MRRVMSAGYWGRLRSQEAALVLCSAPTLDLDPGVARSPEASDADLLAGRCRLGLATVVRLRLVRPLTYTLAEVMR